MGITTACVRISNLADPARSFEDDFIVDTGALYSFAPADRLLAIGVVATRTQPLRLADGTIVHRPLGDVFFEIEGRRSAAPIVLEEPRDAWLLGAVTLEALALKVDPTTSRLEPIVALAVGARPV